MLSQKSVHTYREACIREVDVSGSVISEGYLHASVENRAADHGHLS
jgi:hypothetical protein